MSRSLYPPALLGYDFQSQEPTHNDETIFLDFIYISISYLNRLRLRKLQKNQKRHDTDKVNQADASYFQEVLDQIEDLTRRGQAQAACKILSELDFKKIPKDKRSAFANLAKRNSLPMIGLKILSPVIRAHTDGRNQASAEDLMAYGTLLSQVGCNQEALQLLKPISRKTHSKVDLHRAWALFGLWDYRRATFFLRKFIRNKGNSDYDQVVGKVNLLAALVEQQFWIQADKLIEDLEKSISSDQHALLYGNLHELKAQILIARSEYKQANIALETAAKYLQPTGGIYFLFVKKWKLIIKLIHAEPLAETLNSELESEFTSLVEEAIQMRLWEVTRDLHFYRACAQRDLIYLKSVYYGTSMPSYKKRMLQIAKKFQIKEEDLTTGSAVFRRYDSHVGSPQNLQFDFMALFGRKEILLKAFKVLLSDSFRPFGYGHLYSQLYPNQFFHPDFAIKRIERIVERLKRQFHESQAPFTIIRKNHEFLLVPADGISEIFWNAKNFEAQSLLENCRKIFKGKTFTIKDLLRIAQVSKSTMHRILSQWQGKNYVQSFGNGPACRYIFSNHSF